MCLLYHSHIELLERVPIENVVIYCGFITGFGIIRNVKSFLLNNGRKLSTAPVLLAFRKALTQVIAITFIASMFIILRHPPITGLATDGFLGAWASFAEMYGALLDLGVTLTLGMIGVYALIAFIIHWSHAIEINPYHPLVSGIIVYLMVSVTLQSTASGWTLNPQYLGYSGLLTAFGVGVIAVGAHRIAHRFHLKWFSNTMHSEHLAQPVEAFVTTLILILGAFVSRWVLGDVGIVFPQWVELQVAGWITLTDSIWTLVTVITLVRLLQFVGLDGRGILALTLLPLMVMASAQNLEAFLFDKALPHILASGFLFFDTGVLPLVIAQLVFGKHPQRRNAAKLGLVPALFNLPETVLTGFPVIFNGALLIPFVLTGVTGVTLAYTAMSFYWVNKPLIALSALVPSPLGVFASTLDWRALVLYGLILIVNTLIYWPFIIRLERQAQASEIHSDANVLN